MSGLILWQTADEELNMIMTLWKDLWQTIRSGTLWKDSLMAESQEMRFWGLVRFNYPTHQIVFCTEAALKTLTFEGSETL